MVVGWGCLDIKMSKFNIHVDAITYLWRINRPASLTQWRYFRALLIKQFLFLDRNIIVGYCSGKAGNNLHGLEMKVDFSVDLNTLAFIINLDFQFPNKILMIYIFFFVIYKFCMLHFLCLLIVVIAMYFRIIHVIFSQNGHI